MANEREDFGTGKITLKDIAEKTGYSINTISHALKNKDDISETTKKYIQNIAKDMGYIGNDIAGALRSGTTKTIAIIMGDISNPHFGIIVKEIEDMLIKYDYNTIILNTDENSEREERAIFAALSKKVDGIIICPTQKSEDNVLFLKKLGIPFVLFGRRFSTIETDYVICNDVKGGYLATSHLIAKGHNKILFLNGPSYISSSIERYKGYRDALEDNNIEFNSKLIHEVAIKAGGCRKQLKSIIDDGIDFTAIFAFSDMIAWEAIFTLNEAGIKVPQDKAIVGFDNIQSRLFFPQQLTSIRSFKGKMSHKAVDILMKKINGGNRNCCTKEVIDVKLIERETT
jgi:LacI family transcriptional regulator